MGGKNLKLWESDSSRGKTLEAHRIMTNLFVIDMSGYGIRPLEVCLILEKMELSSASSLPGRLAGEDVEVECHM